LGGTTLRVVFFGMQVHTTQRVVPPTSRRWTQKFDVDGALGGAGSYVARSVPKAAAARLAETGVLGLVQNGRARGNTLLFAPRGRRGVSRGRKPPAMLAL